MFSARATGIRTTRKPALRSDTFRSFTGCVLRFKSTIRCSGTRERIAFVPGVRSTAISRTCEPYIIDAAAAARTYPPPLLPLPRNDFPRRCFAVPPTHYHKTSAEIGPPAFRDYSATFARGVTSDERQGVPINDAA